jgi:ADP-ribose pyrophosphatase YjhB (NUDIX family)
MLLLLFGIDMQEAHDSSTRHGKPTDLLLPNRALQWLLHRWFLTTRAMTLGVRAMVLDSEGQVLLVEHTYTAGWHLPGGGVEIGETLEAALAKELREEAGVSLLGAAALHGIYLNERLGRRDHVAVFVVRDFDWNGAPPPTREIRAARFFALDALPDGTSQATRNRLAEVIEDAPRSALW